MLPPRASETSFDRRAVLVRRRDHFPRAPVGQHARRGQRRERVRRRHAFGIARARCSPAPGSSRRSRAASPSTVDAHALIAEARRDLPAGTGTCVHDRRAARAVRRAVLEDRIRSLAPRGSICAVSCAELADKHLRGNAIDHRRARPSSGSNTVDPVFARSATNTSPSARIHRDPAPPASCPEPKRWINSARRA